MRELRRNCVRYWYNERLLKEPVESVFDPEYWASNQSVIGSAYGRGTTWFVKTQTVEAALRHYYRGGLFGKLVKDLYLFSGWENSRSYKEYELLELLESAGVHVPRPLAARVRRGLFFYQADLLTEKIAQSEDLVSLLSHKEITKEMCIKIGEQIKKMHALNVNHTDLNIHNILIDSNEKVWIIDFDRCYVAKGNGWQQSNLARLKRSFNKEQAKKVGFDVNVEQLFGFIEEGYYAK